MEEVIRLGQSININTKYLSCDVIQEILTCSKRCKAKSDICTKEWNKLVDMLWAHIENGLEKMDDQLLCATCFFSVIIVSENQNEYLEKVQQIIENEMNMKSTSSKESNSLQAMSLMYGMFQSAFLMQHMEHSNLPKLLRSIFDLLIIMGYEYSQFTFMVFKTINAFKKLHGTELQTIVFSNENQTKLLNLVNHNWENPITGVRDLVKDIFQTLVNIVSPENVNKIVQEINAFYWNKAKYLMLSEIFAHHRTEISLLSEEWIDGLIYSLHKPGLVSAGADMYYAVLKKINTEEIWYKIFHEKISKIFRSNSIKAIDNFGNYWLLITLKKFPKIMSILIEELNEDVNTDNEYKSILTIMKQSNKIGILDKHFDSSNNHTICERIILNAIEHCNTSVRLLAFDIICLIQDKNLPSETEYKLVLEYVENNINSDCTVLRINMLNSLGIFLTQLHILFRNTTDNKDKEKLLDFCKSLQVVVLASLNLDGNYQRKCTNVKIINVLIESLSEVPRKRKGHIKSSSISLKDFLQSKHCWRLHDKSVVVKLISLLKDASDDIRENAGKLLLANYSEELRETAIMDQMIKNAIQSMGSKFFFEISCGQSMFRLIVNLLLNKKFDEGKLKSLEDVFDYGYAELCMEYSANRDILKTIEDGKQLHSFISILQVVLDGCIKNSYHLNVSGEKIKNLLEILDHITKQFSWEQKHSTSSDFSRMNEIIEEIIARSGCDYAGKDKTKISGLHQIVLNCLWLNVKASCDLASLIINYCRDDEQICEQSLNIITHVLETSRHKGAIEAAGTSLGLGIQLLTSLPDSSKTSHLPQTLLVSKLDVLIKEATKMASITRRGAGLSIMVHRIVSSDMRKGKPLFHYFMRTLLKTCHSTEDVPSTHDIENQMDLPKAIIIHFLTKIVMDSSLASDMMFYSAELAELAFSNLTSTHWQIRNAALQLYGALIPRLIGQKKASGSDDETIATVAVDELRTHSPKLWSFIMERLKNKSQSSDIISHSDLVPILNLLASCAKRYNFTSDSISQEESFSELLQSLIRILNSPIHTVRRLTARCLFNMFSLQEICNVIAKVEISTENFRHGCLLLVKNCHQDYEKSVEDLCKSILRDQKEISYCSREIFVTIFPEHIASIEDVKTVLATLDKNKTCPGIHKWAQTCVEVYIDQSNWDDIAEMLTLLLDQNDFEIYGQMLISKMEKENYSDELAMNKIAKTLLSWKSKYESCVVWKMLYQIACTINLHNMDVTSILENLEDISYKLRYIFPFVAKMFDKLNKSHQNKFMQFIYLMSDFENSDVDLRYIAALSNNEVPKYFEKVSDDVKMTSLKVAIILLQDEDEDVRNTCVYYYTNLTKQKFSVHPNICLKRMLDYDFLFKILSAPVSVNIICKDLLQIASYNKHDNTDEYNPFANDSKNIYLEVPVFCKTVENIINKI